MVTTEEAIKIGLVAGLVSAFYPSIPTIIKFEYYKEQWFLAYCLLTGLFIYSMFSG